MKLFKQVLLALAFVLPTCFVSSCGDDDEPEIKPEAIASEISFEGITTVHPTTDPSATFTTNASTYTFTLDEKNQVADLKIGKAKFMEAMPELDMDFNDINYTTIETAINFSCTALTPEIGGRPFPQFPITELSGVVKTSVVNNKYTPASIELTFICTWNGTPFNIVFKGTPKK